MFHKLLDSRDLSIKEVRDDATGQKLEFSVEEPGYVGSKVEITLPNTDSKE